MMRRLSVLIPLAGLTLAACGGPGAAGDACDPAAEDPCDTGLTCTVVEGGEAEHACFAPVRLEGTVIDALDGSVLTDGHVIVLDTESVAVSDVGVTDGNGAWSLAVPVARDPEGKPLANEFFTLRADADGYQGFPGGLRAALPINAADAVLDEDETWVIDTALTDVALLPLPAEEAGHRVEGTVLAGDASAGVLVVATGASGTRTTVTDRNGGFTLFDVADGAVSVKGYKAGVQLTPADLVMAGADVTDVELQTSDASTSRLHGSVQIVNPGDGKETSVVLVVADTFDPISGRGEVPPGLRAPQSGPVAVTGEWEIQGVPDGEYLVLAAFENDRLVRDPDTSIGGTETLQVTVPDPTLGNDFDAGSFKVTGALAIYGPGAERADVVGPVPTFEWEDDSSEDTYELVVYDAFGNLVWEHTRPGVSSGSVVVDYAGPALESGMYYQFRATSLKGGVPLSSTEDLLGVFVVE